MTSTYEEKISAEVRLIHAEQISALLYFRTPLLLLMTHHEKMQLKALP